MCQAVREKSLTYARNNIPEYWVIDLVNNQVIVSTNPNNNQYQNKQEFTIGTIKTLAFPNVEIAVDRLLLFTSQFVFCFVVRYLFICL